MSDEPILGLDPWSAECPKCQHVVTAPQDMTIQVCEFCGSDVRKPAVKIKRKKKPQTLAEQVEADRKAEQAENLSNFVWGLGAAIGTVIVLVFGFILLREVGLALYDWASQWREASQIREACWESRDVASDACKVVMYR